MHAKRHSKFHKFFLVIPVAALTALGLYGVSQAYGGGWGSHGHGGGWHSAERMEKRMTWIQEEVAEDLEIRPEQEPAFNALAEAFKNHARAWKAGWRETGSGIKEEFNRETLDTGRISELLKERIHNRPSNDSLDALVDQSVAFYQVLDPEQQQVFKEKVVKRLNRHF